jgi:hypothetical protein
VSDRVEAAERLDLKGLERPNFEAVERLDLKALDGQILRLGRC